MVSKDRTSGTSHNDFIGTKMQRRDRAIGSEIIDSDGFILERTHEL
jgi:hypothetical protein